MLFLLWISEVDQERCNVRITLSPYLQAEEDIRYVLFFVFDNRYCAAEAAKLEREKEVMKDIPGWEVGKSVYHTRKWMPRPEY